MTRFVSESENLVLNYLIHCKPIKKFKNWTDLKKFLSSVNEQAC
jgi:hypothetical protein